jgi:hypothetical protein
MDNNYTTQFMETPSRPMGHHFSHESKKASKKIQLADQPALLKKLLVLLIVATFPLFAHAQTNLALSATASRSSGGSGIYGPANFNDGVIGAVNSGVYGWVADGALPNWIEYTWSSAVEVNEVIWYLSDRPMNSTTIQYWDGVAYIDLQPYTRPGGVTDNDVVVFPRVATTRLRFANVTNSGFNPNFREIEVYNVPVATGTNPATCGGADGKITVNGGLLTNQAFIVSYKKDGNAVPAYILMSDASGNLVYTGLSQGVYTDIFFTDGVNPKTIAGPVTLTDPAPPAAPSLSSNTPVCEGAALNLGTTTTGVAYSWSGPNGFTSTDQNPSIPSATLAAAGTYSLGIVDNSTLCTNQATTAVVVNPIPTVDPVSGQTLCNMDMTTAISFTGTGTAYDWTNSDPSIGLAAAGTGNIAAFTATNAMAWPLTSTVTVTPTANGCTGVV